MKKRIRSLLVGFGDMGRNYHLPTLTASPDVEVVGIVRARLEAVEETLPVYTRLDTALKETSTELAVIATPHSYHYSQAWQCLQFGCHVFVEKPLALSYSEAENLVSFADTRGKLLVVGLQRRYEGAASIYRQLMCSDRIGRTNLVHGLFAHRFGHFGDATWRTDPALAGRGILDDSAFHLMDMLLYYAGGEIESLQCNSIYEDDPSLPHSFTSMITTSSGTSVSACGSYLSPINSVQEELSVWGTRGSLFIRRFCPDWNALPPRVVYKSANGSEKEEFDLRGLPIGRNLPLQYMLDVLAGNAPQEVLLTQGRQTLITHRAVELMREQQSTTVPREI